MAQPEVVIVAADGTEHVFPPGFDPKKAAAIVRRQSDAPADQAGMLDGLLGAVKGFGKDAVDAGVGIAKGAARSAVGAGRLVEAVTPIERLTGGIPSDAETQLGLDPTNDSQKGGMLLEQLLEFFAPGGATRRATTSVARRLPQAARIVPQIVGEAGTSAGVTALQGGDVKTAATAGAVVPVVGKVTSAVGRKIGERAIPLVRAAIKPTVTEMKQQAGASMQGISQAADRLAKFVIDNRLTSPAKAQAIIDDAEREIATLVTNVPTDAPARAARYLKALERSAAKQGLPASDVSAIKSAAKELIDESPMGETVTKTVMRPSPTGLVTAAGKPVMAPTQETSRALRASMPADEALETARGSSRWSTRKAWGEQKGATTEAAKAVERGARDAVKTAIPATKPVLAREGQAIQAKKVLDRKAFREGNRDAISLPAHVIAAGEIARGKVPVLAFAANWLRNNQLKAGIYADVLSKAIARKDTKTVSEILGKLGVAATAQASNPAYAR